MKIAIFSDIHGNDIAYEAAINDAKERGATEFIITGDLISDFPFASQVIARTKALTKNVVKGNREEYFKKYYTSEDLHWKEYRQFAGMLWSFDHMSKDDFDYICNLTDEIEVNFCDGLCLFATHYIKEPNDFISKTSANVIVGGHTHKPLELRYGDKIILNPGSVGVNISIGFNAEYMLLECTNGIIQSQIIHVPYDAEKIKTILYDISIIDNQAALDWFKILFATQASGNNYISELFQMNEKIKAERGILCYDMPNEIWDEIINSFKNRKII